MFFYILDVFAQLDRSWQQCTSSVLQGQEQDKSSNIEQQPPFGDRKISNIQPQNKGGGTYQFAILLWFLRNDKAALQW